MHQPLISRCAVREIPRTPAAERPHFTVKSDQRPFPTGWLPATITRWTQEDLPEGKAFFCWLRFRGGQVELPFICPLELDFGNNLYCLLVMVEHYGAIEDFEPNSLIGFPVEAEVVYRAAPPFNNLQLFVNTLRGSGARVNPRSGIEIVR